MCRPQDCQTGGRGGLITYRDNQLLESPSYRLCLDVDIDLIVDADRLFLTNVEMKDGLALNSLYFILSFSKMKASSQRIEQYRRL